MSDCKEGSEEDIENDNEEKGKLAYYTIREILKDTLEKIEMENKS